MEICVDDAIDKKLKTRQSDFLANHSVILALNRNITEQQQKFMRKVKSSLHSIFMSVLFNSMTSLVVV